MAVEEDVWRVIIASLSFNKPSSRRLDKNNKKMRKIIFQLPVEHIGSVVEDICVDNNININDIDIAKVSQRASELMTLYQQLMMTAAYKIPDLVVAARVFYRAPLEYRIRDYEADAMVSLTWQGKVTLEYNSGGDDRNIIMGMDASKAILLNEDVSAAYESGKLDGKSEAVAMDVASCLVRDNSNGFFSEAAEFLKLHGGEIISHLEEMDGGMLHVKFEI